MLVKIMEIQQHNMFHERPHLAFPAQLSIKVMLREILFITFFGNSVLSVD
jgi:hypothetical protein